MKKAGKCEVSITKDYYTFMHFTFPFIRFTFKQLYDTFIIYFCKLPFIILIHIKGLFLYSYLLYTIDNRVRRLIHPTHQF